jgi:hypothetical protein
MWFLSGLPEPTFWNFQAILTSVNQLASFSEVCHFPIIELCGIFSHLCVILVSPVALAPRGGGGDKRELNVV